MRTEESIDISGKDLLRYQRSIIIESEAPIPAACNKSGGDHSQTAAREISRENERFDFLQGIL